LTAAAIWRHLARMEMRNIMHTVKIFNSTRLRADGRMRGCA